MPVRRSTFTHVVEGAAYTQCRAACGCETREAAETRRQELLRHLKPCPWGLGASGCFSRALSGAQRHVSPSLLRPAICSALLKAPLKAAGDRHAKVRQRGEAAASERGTSGISRTSSPLI